MSKSEFITVCFKNFDNISKKLILSRLNDPQYSIEQMKDPEDADLCVFNQEYKSRKKFFVEAKPLYKRFKAKYSDITLNP